MAEYKRDRRIFRAFHSTDDDALDILMGMYDQAYPELDARKRVEIKMQAQDAIDGAQTTNSWFLISPEGQIQLVPALAMALAFEDVETDVWYEVQAERVRQFEKGYAPEHDDAHGGQHLIDIATSYLFNIDGKEGTEKVRQRAIKSIATLVALVEFLDRVEANNVVGQLEVEESIDAIEDAIQDDPPKEERDAQAE